MTQSGSTTFLYSEYLSDYLKSYLRDHGDEMSPDQRDVISQVAVIEQNRDDDIEDYLAQTTYVPSIGVIRAVAENIPDATGTAVTFEGIDFQSTAVFNWLAADPSKVSTDEQGIIAITANVTFAAAAGGVLRSLAIYQNGIQLVSQSSGPFGGTPQIGVGVPVTVTAEAGDYFQAFVYQDSGGALGVTSKLQMSYLGLAG